MTRHMFLNYPSSPQALDLNSQLMLGTDVLLAPVFSPSVSTVDIVIPQNEKWRLIWNDSVFYSQDSWKKYTIDAPLGSPAVFCKDGTPVCAALTQAVLSSR